MKGRVALGSALALLPGAAAACPTCIGAAYGDRTFNWAYLGLLLLPFGLVAVIAAVLAGCYWGPKWRARLARLGGPFHRSPRGAGAAGPTAAARLARLGGPFHRSPRGAGAAGPTAAARLARLGGPFHRSPRGAGAASPTAAARLAQPPIKEML